MLTQFVTKYVFNKLVAKVYVDVDGKSAEITLLYDRLIRRTENLRFSEVDTPDKCDAWMRRSQPGDYASLMESWEAQYRNQWGIGAPDVSANDRKAT